MLSTHLFDYHLPPERIAQLPLLERDHARLMVVNRASGKVSHKQFNQLPTLLEPGTALIRNTTAVLKARLPIIAPNGSKAECFLLKPCGEAHTWWCLLKPGKKLKKQGHFYHPDAFKACVLEQNADGLYRVSFELTQDTSILAMAERIGSVPLPPYIHRETPTPWEASRYQTVYADPAQKQSLAAPTAGLHFTESLLTELSERGFPLYAVNLCVGLGTFQPIHADTLESHTMHTEAYEIPPLTQHLLASTAPLKRLAVGSTTLRAIEAYAQASPQPSRASHCYETNLFIRPPYVFQKTDALITNFHLPRSTLLCLVAAFLEPGGMGGITWMRQLYQEAIDLNYRFFSYGDAMLII